MTCPQCGLSHIKKNGHTSYGEQNYACLNKSCKRQFIEDAHHISEETKKRVRRLLLERISLLGICRVMDVSLSWLLRYCAELYRQLPDDLNAQYYQGSGDVQLFHLDLELDELWSFVGYKANKQWVWIALDVATRQVIAFYVGDRSRKSAKALWKRIPACYQEQATFYTDGCESYDKVVPAIRHRVCAKGSGHTNAVERFNCTLRQRVSRLVRKALSFSKDLGNHIGAIKYFICHYNLLVTNRL
ncbi:MAG: IS1 family transposase [Blastocatellia bacterium]